MLARQRERTSGLGVVMLPRQRERTSDYERR